MRSFITKRIAAVIGMGVLFCGGASLAEEVVLEAPPTVEQVQGAQTTTTTVTTTRTAPAAPQGAPPVIVPAAPQAPVAVPGAAPAQGPMYFNGPVYVIPAPVTGQPMSTPSVAPTLPPPPMYRPPVYRARTASCCTMPSPQARYVAKARGPVFSMGLRFTSMGINQEVFGQNVNLLGGGLQFRFRNQGHWGFESAFDVLRANIGEGAYVRTTFPWTVGAMLYAFKNRPSNHFNLYAVAGFGILADDVKLYRDTPQERHQQFMEIMGHVGGGAELRFNRLAISADIRAVGMALDDSSPAGEFYQGVTDGPIPLSSLGYKANIAAMLAF